MAADDDNPSINRYVGDFEAEASYRYGTQTFTLIGRSTWDAKRGFAQIDWTFPLREKLKGYVQFTTGYGESLIDYNHRQDTIGIGVLLTDWM
jgi:phospholipase A1